MATFNRRKIIAAASVGAVYCPQHLVEEAWSQQPSIRTEVQYGDPEMLPEELQYSRASVTAIVTSQQKATLSPRIKYFGNALIDAAGSYVGKSRSNDEEDITKFLEMFKLPFSSRGKLVPFCAAGISWVATTLYAGQDGLKSSDFRNNALRPFLVEIDQMHFYPTPSVIDMREVAQGKRNWISRSLADNGSNPPQKGWLVVFNWNQDGKPDHVGLVEEVGDDYLKTIEFNTSVENDSNGGQIARRVRGRNATIEGYIRTHIS